MPAPVVVVLGCGLAGILAAIEADTLGASVIVLEKNSFVGGNSAKATSGINGVGTPAQAALGITDSVPLFFEDTILSGQNLSDQELVRVLTKESGATLEYLSSFSLEFNAVSQCGGHQAARTHRFAEGAGGKPKPVGFGIMSALKAYVQSRARNITIQYKARATRLVMGEAGGEAAGRVVAVEYTTPSATADAASSPSVAQLLPCDAVVLATGGFGGDAELLSEFAAHLLPFPTTGGPWTTGDGVKMGRAVGATLQLMDQVQVHPTGFVDPRRPLAPSVFLAPEALRAVGGLLLNAQAQRFVNELGLRDAVAAAIAHTVQQPQPQPQQQQQQAHSTTATTTTTAAATAFPSAFLLLNEEMAVAFGKPSFSFYAGKGLFRRFADGYAAAADLGLPVSQLEATLLEYQQRIARAAENTPCAKPRNATATDAAAATAAAASTAAPAAAIGAPTAAAAEETGGRRMEVQLSPTGSSGGSGGDEEKVGYGAPTAAAATSSSSDRFGRTVFTTPAIRMTEPLYVAVVTPAVHYTMGGLRIDAHGRVLSSNSDDDDDSDGRSSSLSAPQQQQQRQQQQRRRQARPIPGLFAAGEVAGGLHGANRLAGNSLLECAVFGRIAGASAARSAKAWQQQQQQAVGAAAGGGRIAAGL